MSKSKTITLTDDELRALRELLTMSRVHLAFDAKDLKAYTKFMSLIENKLKSKS